jgi:hypothetical protein
MSLDWSYNWKIVVATYCTTPRSVVQLLTTVADCLHSLTFIFVTNLARFLKNSLSHASGVLHDLTRCIYGGTSATTKTRYNVDSTTNAATATGYYCWNVVYQKTKTLTKKTSTILGACLQFQRMFMHDFVSIERLLWPVVWAVVASYDWLHDRSLIATTSSTIVNCTTDLFLFHFIVRLMYHQPYDPLQPIAGESQYAIASENRVEWSYFALLSLVARFQNRAIRCDWGLSVLSIEWTYMYIWPFLINNITLFVLSRTSNFSAIWRLSPLPLTGLQL